MNKRLSSKGITLVSLVITIILLLILAAVTITLVFNKGIFNKANNVNKDSIYTSEYQMLLEELSGNDVFANLTHSKKINFDNPNDITYILDKLNERSGISDSNKRMEMGR